MAKKSGSKESKYDVMLKERLDRSSAVNCVPPSFVGKGLSMGFVVATSVAVAPLWTTEVITTIKVPVFSR